MRRADRAPGHSASPAPVAVRRRGPLQAGTAALLAVLTLAAVACTDSGETGESGEDRTADNAGPPSDTADLPSDIRARPELLSLPDAPAEACTAVLEHGLAIEARTRGALRAELGEPDSVGREAVPNRHIPEATDTVVTMRWPHATAVVRVAQSKELVDAIRVTDIRHLRYAGVGPGTPRDSILGRLGDPGRRVGGGETVPIGRHPAGEDDTEPPADPAGSGAAAPAQGSPDPVRPEPETLSYWCPSEPGAESPVLFHLRGGRVAAVEWDFYVD